MSMEDSYRSIWLWSLGAFILAGLTGFFYRYGLMGYDLGGLPLENIRHAHSHLMFFSWITPIPMLFMARALSAESMRINAGMKRSIYAVLILGICSWPFFLLYGYRPVSLGTAQLPMSVILSGLVMIAWYFFIGFYRNLRRQHNETRTLSMYDAALLMLAVSSLGAWGVAVTQFSGVENPLYGKALTHFFLATFTEGWCVLAVLGVLYQQTKTGVTRNSLWLTLPILIGAPLTFPLGMSAQTITPAMLVAARIGSLLVAVGIILNGLVLLKQKPSWIWLVPLIFLGFKAVMQISSGIMPSSFWLGDYNLRILYLHITLLGFGTSGLFAGWFADASRYASFWGMTVAIIAVILSLLLLTPVIPATLSGPWIYPVLMSAALLPVITAGWVFIRIHNKTRSLPQ